MRFYWPIAKVDAERRMVWGYASTDAEDDQGETITREALAAALDDYMRFANIREMHQPSAVGVATEATIDDKGLYLGAKIVDADAWRKVAEGVYKGFSIGGSVTARDPADRRLITGLRLTEISVVDRPANPEAVFDCWKFSTGPAPGGGMAITAAIARSPAQAGSGGNPDEHRQLRRHRQVRAGKLRLYDVVLLERTDRHDGATVLGRGAHNAGGAVNLARQLLFLDGPGQYAAGGQLRPWHLQRAKSDRWRVPYRREAGHHAALSGDGHGGRRQRQRDQRDSELRRDIQRAAGADGIRIYSAVRLG